MKCALVTGGAGFIGSHIVEHLVNRGLRVKVLDNLSSGRRHNIAHLNDSVGLQIGDIRDRQCVQRVIRDCDVVFHQAAVVSVPKTVEDPLTSAEINDMGTLNVLEAARNAGVRRVVLASSCAVYGDDPQLPKDERSVLKAQSPYALQKRFNEMQAALYHELYGLETACLRYFNVYGPRQDPSSPYSGVISIFLTKALNKEPPMIYGDGRQSRDFVFVQDVVRANVLAATTEKAAGHVVNIGSAFQVGIRQLWDMICKMADIQIAPEHHAERRGDIRASLACVDKARALLGYSPRWSFEKGLAQTYAWYRETQA